MFKRYVTFDEAMRDGLDLIGEAAGQERDDPLSAGISYTHAAHAFTEAQLRAALMPETTMKVQNMRRAIAAHSTAVELLDRLGKAVSGTEQTNLRQQG